MKEATEDDLNKLKEQLNKVLDLLKTDRTKKNREELNKELNKIDIKLKEIYGFVYDPWERFNDPDFQKTL